MTKNLKFKLIHVLFCILVASIALACFIEQEAVIGRSSTPSPDNEWKLNLKLTEHSTLFYSRRMLHTHLEHSTNSEWDVGTSIPFNDADARTISNGHPDHPVVWTGDSSTVTYWINEKLDDWMKIEANSRQHKFQRKLYSFTATMTPAEDGG